MGWYFQPVARKKKERKCAMNYPPPSDMNVVQQLVTVYWGAFIKIRDKSLGGGQSSNQDVWLTSWMTLIPPLSLVNASILLLHVEACWPVRDVRQEAHVLHVRCLTSSYAAVVPSSRWSLLQPHCRRSSQKLCVFGELRSDFTNTWDSDVFCSFLLSSDDDRQWCHTLSCLN